jgi:transposase
MLTQGEDVEAHALRERGWSISAIARHLERDRKTVRSYLNGDRQPGTRVTAVADPLADFEGYIRARFGDDPHLWATSLFVEVAALGYERSYPSFVRQVRQRGLRPHCEACRGVKGRDTIEIEHPPGEEIQWDWFERRRAPWGGTAYVLLGTLPYSSRTRGVLAESLDQAHLVEAMDAVMRRLGGTARVWRTDRLATVIVPGSRDVQPSFAPVAKHYGAIVEPCPPRRGNRKGAVEAAVRYVCGRWWRTSTATGPEEAQLSLDRFLATVDVTRVVAPNATVAFRGNRYAVPPGLTDTNVHLRHRLGSATVEICSAAGATLAAHRLAPAGAGSIVRSAEQHAALERVVLSAFSTDRPCDRKANRPPGPEALAAAATLLGGEGRPVVVDLAAYAVLVEGAS